jgi:hypothetical protein
VTEAELGYGQIRQCRKSIQTFAKSALAVEQYWLVYNRKLASAAFHTAIRGELDTLKNKSRVAEARLLNHDDFLVEILNSLYARFRRFVSARAHAFRVRSGGPLGVPDWPVEEVPYQLREVRVSQYRFDDTAPALARFGDPTAEFNAPSGDVGSRMALLLGEFGMGKTTLAFRLAEGSEASVLYVPAAVFPPRLSGTKELLNYFTGAAEFIEASFEDKHPALQGMSRLMSEKMLAHNDTNILLVIDGLDESPFLTAGNGLPTLFDALSNIRARAVLTMRTEFWQTHSEELLTGYEGRAAPQVRSERNRRLTRIELSPWTNREILLLIERTLAREEAAQARQNLEALRRIVEENAYVALYGDIPTKPLFLRLLLEFVAERGIHETSLAELFREWIRLKLRRDALNPLLHGTTPRIGITAPVQPVDVVQVLATQAMKAAAALMTSLDGDCLNLLPTCDFDLLADRVPALRGQADMTGLVLNSLLMPIERHGCIRALRFAHRAFQEYFLARCIVEDRAFAHLELPVEVSRWVERLQ